VLLSIKVDSVFLSICMQRLVNA